MNKLRLAVIATSTKKDGDMSFVKGNVKNTLVNRKRFLANHGVSLNEIVALQTPHKTSIHRAILADLGKGSQDAKTVIFADRLTTDQKRVYLFLLTADCLPVVLYDPDNQAVSLIHVSRHNISSIIGSQQWLV